MLSDEAWSDPALLAFLRQRLECRCENGGGERFRPERARKLVEILHAQALLIAGLPLEDPAGYTDLVCELMK